MAYIDEVENWIGTFADTGAIDTWLTEGAAKVLDILPMKKASLYTVLVEDTSGGITVTGRRILDGYIASSGNEGEGARFVEHGLSDKVKLSTSIHFAVATDPIWFIHLGLAKIFPSSGSRFFHTLLYPTVLNTDSAIIKFPAEYDGIMVLYAAIRALTQQMNTLSQSTLNGITFNVNVEPPVPTYPSLAYSIPVFGGSFTNIDSALSDEDVELASGHVQTLQAHLEEYNRDLQNNWQDFQEELNNRQALVQEYSAEIQTYSQNIQQEIQRIGSLSQKHVSQHGAMQAQYAVMKKEYDENLAAARRGE